VDVPAPLPAGVGVESVLLCFFFRALLLVVEPLAAPFVVVPLPEPIEPLPDAPLSLPLPMPAPVPGPAARLFDPVDPVLPVPAPGMPADGPVAAPPG
jgi:hypothetical protein